MSSMKFREKVRDILSRLDIEKPEISFLDGFGYRVVAVLVSPTFESIDDGLRQRMVWSAFLDELTDDEQRDIETVFTLSPSEYEAEEAGEASPEVLGEL